MKARLYLFALAAVLVLSASALAQRGPQHGTGSGTTTEGGVFNGQPGVGVTSRVFTDAILRDANGAVIGKAKTATVQTSSGNVVQGLRVQVTGLTPGAEYALVIDGTLVGTGTADANGVLRLKFLSPTNGRAQAIPDAIKPIANAHTAQIFEATSQAVVASGTFTSGGAK
jgi:hypothetical protein